MCDRTADGAAATEGAAGFKQAGKLQQAQGRAAPGAGAGTRMQPGLESKSCC